MDAMSDGAVSMDGERSAPDRWGFFDACAVVGRGVSRSADSPTSAAELLADMDRHGVAEGMVVDCLARENHPTDGNARVLEVCRGEPRLHPGWVALPHGPADEQLPGEAFVEEMRRNRVGAVYLYPEQYRFGLADWCVDDFLEPLAAVGVPIFVNYNAADSGRRVGWAHTDLEAVVGMWRRWPELRVYSNSRPQSTHSPLPDGSVSSRFVLRAPKGEHSKQYLRLVRHRTFPSIFIEQGN